MHHRSARNGPVQEFDGSDSGARPDEAVSWGKIRIDAKPVKVRCGNGCALLYPPLLYVWEVGGVLPASRSSMHAAQRLCLEASSALMPSRPGMRQLLSLLTVGMPFGK